MRSEVRTSVKPNNFYDSFSLGRQQETTEVFPPKFSGSESTLNTHNTDACGKITTLGHQYTDHGVGIKGDLASTNAMTSNLWLRLISAFFMRFGSMRNGLVKRTIVKFNTCLMKSVTCRHVCIILEWYITTLKLVLFLIHF